MSFIYNDKELLNKLFKSANDFDLKFNKQAQLNNAYQNYLTLTDKLVDNLRSQLFAPQETSNLSANQEAPLNITDLSNLGNFLNYTVRNNIKINNLPIVVPANEPNPNPETYWPISADESRPLMETVDENGQRTDFKADFWVNKNLLTQYIQTINKEVSKLPQEHQMLSKTLLNGIIQKINTIFKTNLTNEYKAPNANISENQIVDYLPQSMGIASWKQTGQIALTLADLKSSETLNDWLESKNINIQGQTLRDLGGKDFVCKAIQILYTRALTMSNSMTSRNKAFVSEYLKRIIAIAHEVKCDISKPLSSDNNINQTNNQQSNTNQSAGQTAVNEVATIQQLAAMHPFNSEQINFQELVLFAKTYGALANNADVNAIVNKIIADANSATSKIGSSMPLLIDNITPSLVSTWTSQPLVLVNVLISLIQNAGRLYAYFYQTNRDKLENWAEQKHLEWAGDALRSMEQQITSGGPQQTNLNNLMGVKSMIMEAIQRH